MLFCLSHANIGHFRKKNRFSIQKQDILSKSSFNFTKFLIYTQADKFLRSQQNHKRKQKNLSFNYDKKLKKNIYCKNIHRLKK